MTRPGSVPITRLRFRGRTPTLKALVAAFRDNPRRPLTAKDLADLSGCAFADVHQRLAETPELFVPLPKKPGTIARYRLATSVERQQSEETDRLIDREARNETLMAVLIVTGIVVVAVGAGALSVLT